MPFVVITGVCGLEHGWGGGRDSGVGLKAGRETVSKYLKKVVASGPLVSEGPSARPQTCRGRSGHTFLLFPKSSLHMLFPLPVVLSYSSHGKHCLNPT